MGEKYTHQRIQENKNVERKGGVWEKVGKKEDCREKRYGRE